MGALSGLVRVVWFVTVGWVIGLTAYFGGMFLSLIPFLGLAGRQLARNSWKLATLG
jgi:hypothetical protein